MAGSAFSGCAQAAIVAAALFGAPSLGSAQPARAMPKIERIAIRLLYETTGAISDSIAPPAKFEGWNTIIGEGDAKEPASDVLIQVHLSVRVEEANVDTPLVVRVTDSKGRGLASRTFKGLLFKRGRVVRTVLAPAATCAGRLRVEAAIGRERRETSVKLACGE